MRVNGVADSLALSLPLPTVLLVDDDVHVLALLSKVLLAGGFDVRLATSAAMAMELIGAASSVPDLAILDMHMPMMSGLQLARTFDGGKVLPFLMMSAGGGETSVRRAAEQGAVGYLVKPLDISQLLPTVITGLAVGRQIKSLHESETRLCAALQFERDTAMAVGLLMERFRLDDATALLALREHARAHSCEVGAFAKRVLDTSKGDGGTAMRLMGVQAAN